MTVQWPSWDDDCLTTSNVKISGTLAITEDDGDANISGTLYLKNLATGEQEDFAISKTL